MSEPSEVDQQQLTGVDFCPTCEFTVTYERHIDESTGRIVHDACRGVLVPHEADNPVHARALSSHETAHQHQLVDADAAHPMYSGIPGNFRAVMRTPIRCISCNAEQDALIADLREHGHDVVIEDGRIIADLVRP